MDLNPNDKTMREMAENAQGGVATLEMPSLKDIAKESPERAKEIIMQFKDFYTNAMMESDTAIFEKDHELMMAAEDLRKGLENTFDHGNALAAAELVNLQRDLSSVWSDKFSNLPDDEISVGSMNPFMFDLVGLHVEGMKLNESKISMPEKERLQKAMEKEAEKSGVEVSKPLSLTKDQLKEVAAEVAKIQNNPEMMNRVKVADEVQVIESSPKEVKEAAKQVEQKESALWSMTKKGILYLAIGTVLAGVVTYGVVTFAPGIAAAIKGWIDSMLPGFLTGLTQSLSKGITVVKDGLVWVGDQLSHVWNSLWGTSKSIDGIGKTTEAMKEALKHSMGGLGGSGGPVLPGLPGSP